MVDYKQPFTKEELKAGAHRIRVGGKWEQMGKLQNRFMKAQGMQPHHYLLDVGCGSLRGGRRFVRYLEPGHYYGIDINETLLRAGYNRELGPKMREKLPRKNLAAVDRFECDMFGVKFDYAIAQSVFTHVSLNHVRLALHQVAKAMKPGGAFYATFFEAPPDLPLDGRAPDRRRAAAGDELVLVLRQRHGVGCQLRAVGVPLHRRLEPPGQAEDGGIHTHRGRHVSALPSVSPRQPVR